ncbi:MAG: enoyl-CoA hydratase/isomerase family protein [Flavobacteriaceae bacterium]|nr:enoyl-CoA hydratase/isomerase family protein [Flavobacteriaceae bacterium]
MTKGTIQTHIENKVATLTFFHPASNSFPSELLNRLINEIKRLSKDDLVHVIILQSEGDKAFCAGASFDELLAIKNIEDGKQFFSGFANLINSLRTCPKIIIGRAQGKAVGGGLGILAATDYCFATEAADIKLSELSIGIGPFVIAPVIERKMGVSALSELSLDAKNWKTAYWAKEKGLFAKVFENIQDMDESIGFLSQNLASYNLEALSAMKKMFWENTDHWDSLLIKRAAISGELVLSDFTVKALNNFKK